MERHTYIAIDLKSFFASVECVERGLNPLTTNLVVADESRTEKTICLAVSPSLRAYGIPGRARLFEVVQKVKMINNERKYKAHKSVLTDSSYDDDELKASTDLALSYIVASPRMAYYMEYSTRIYGIYLKYIAPEDIHVYSIDEVFIDASSYLNTYKFTARDLAKKMIDDVMKSTGITATVGIGTNLYLCKIAMDIVAKHILPDKQGVRIAELDEISYRKMLWDHRPLTDFWRLGKGYAKKLEENRLFTMGDVARCSMGKKTDYYNEDLLYKLFGINAELLIDHAWGWEPCRISDIKSYKSLTNSISLGQVLQCPYDFTKAKLIVREMANALALDLLEKRLVTDQVVLTLDYDVENMNSEEKKGNYNGEYTVDRYGREVPKSAHGTENISRQTSSVRLITDAFMRLYYRITNRKLTIRRMYLVANRVVNEDSIEEKSCYGQLNLFTDYEEERKKRESEELALKRERNMQQAIIGIKKKFGKNAVLLGTNLEEGATMIQRNGQIGGHKA